ncbi:MAG: NAD/NADP octopine/nopaline dehydrogenase family protein [Aminivibrio sp.]|jgi:opine dehydrogenase
MKAAVIGTGNIGLATAGHLALLGHETRLFEFPEFGESIRAAEEKGFIEVESLEINGLPSGRAPLAYAGTDLSKALDGADFIVSAVPSYGEAKVAEACAPLLKSGQKVFLASGYMYGSVEFLQTLRKHGNRADTAVMEMNNSIYAGRKFDGNKVSIGCYKKGLGMASFPGKKGREMIDFIHRVYPEAVLWDSVFGLGVSNPSVPIHAGVVVWNPSYVEQAADVFLYHEGKHLRAFGEAAGRAFDDMDRERMALAGTSLVDWLEPWSKIFLNWYEYQGARGERIFEIMRSNEGLAKAQLPKAFDHRYLTEDVCAGLIPLIELLDRYGLPADVCRAVLHLSSSLSGIDLAARARDLKALGLGGLSDDELKEYMYRGI